MRIKSLVLSAVCTLVPLLGAFACKSPSQTTSVGTEVVSMQRVLARLNGEAVLEDEFEEFLSMTQGELIGDPQPAPRKELFKEFLTRKLLLKKAIESGIKVDDLRVEEYIRQWTSREVEEAQGFSQQMRDFLKVQKLISQQIRPDVNVSLSEILRYYERNAEQFVMEDQAHVLEILTRDRREAIRIRKELDSGDIRDFKEKARRFSIGVTAATGGDLGFFQRGDLPEDFEKAIFSLKTGQLGEPFESVYGFHIFLIEEWIPRHAQKFFEVRDQIFEILVAEKERAATKAILNNLLGEASLEVYDSSLEFLLEERNSDEKTENLDTE